MAPIGMREAIWPRCAVSCLRGHFEAGGQTMSPTARAAPLLVSVFAIAFTIMAVARDKDKPPATYPALKTEIPAKFKPVTAAFDHERREEMVPMRDGVKLHTVILVPKGAKKAPILLTRTPSSAD